MSVLDNIYFSRFIRPMNLGRKAHDSESLLYILQLRTPHISNIYFQFVHSIYNVLNLRSSKCSDICIYNMRHRRTGIAPSLRSAADCRAHPKYESTIHMRPPLAIHGSMTACLNIVFKHG